MEQYPLAFKSTASSKPVISPLLVANVALLVFVTENGNKSIFKAKYSHGDCWYN